MVTYLIDSDRELFTPTEAATILGYVGYQNFFHATNAEPPAHPNLKKIKLGEHKNSPARYTKSELERELNEVSAPLGTLRKSGNVPVDQEALTKVYENDNTVRLVPVGYYSWLNDTETAEILGHSSKEAFNMAKRRGKHDLLPAHRIGRTIYLFHKDDVAAHFNRLIESNVLKQDGQGVLRHGYRRMSVSGLVRA